MLEESTDKHKTYGRCGCKWLETRVPWCRPIFKKMVEIYITFWPKCVSCELFQLIWPDKSCPPLQYMETGNWPSDETWCVSWLVHSRLASVQAGREVCPSELHSLTFSILYKKYQTVEKCVLCVYRKRKKLHPEGVDRQHINVSSVIFHCAVWGVYWNTTNVEVQN